jgi:indolepyruvate ferredoxin oxidoreductase
VAAGKETLQRLRPGRSHVALNTSATPTAAFVKNPNWANPAQACVDSLVATLGEQAVGRFDAELVATRMMGDAIYTNPLMLGYAWQQGWLPLGLASLMRAIELNAVQVEKNKQAFEWGRRAAHNPQAMAALLAQGASQVIEFKPRETVDALVARRVAFLTEYQNAAYAAEYEAWVRRVQQAEAPLGKTALTETVARHLFKLMAYKDEYEVARLHTDPAFHARLAEQFEPGYALKLHLAPPLLARKNERGELQKRQFGPWMFTAMRLLAKFKGVRGTALDVFGRTDERRTERALIQEYRLDLDRLLGGLSAERHALALRLASWPDAVRGYGHVKERHLHQALSQREAAWAEWERPA